MTMTVKLDESVVRKRTRKRASPARVSANATAFGFFLLAVLVTGWLFHDRLELDPRGGIGYWLGIIGTSMMVLLLGYPLRKRGGAIIPGTVGTWFRIHMTFGLVGPLLILFHAGFSWNALNSGVALWAMILVVLSGLIGRYLHGHLYSRHSLRHREAGDIMRELRRRRDRLDSDGALGEAVEARLAEFQDIVTHPRRRLSRALYRSAKLTIAITRSRSRLMNEACAEVDAHLARLGAPQKERDAVCEEVRRHLQSYLDALLDAGTFATFERLFALWHIAHIPLYLFLAVTAIIHILAAHYF